MATSAITPNPSEVPPAPEFEPSANESTKVEVIGPEATPPESNAIAVKVSGHQIINKSAITYPGTIMYIKLNPKIPRIIVRPIAIAAPIERKININFRFIVPPLNDSTCSVKTQTAGSAQTTTAPRTNPVIIRMIL